MEHYRKAGYVTTSQLEAWQDYTARATENATPLMEVSEWLALNPHSNTDTHIVKEIMSIEKCIDMIAECVCVSSHALKHCGSIEGALLSKAEAERSLLDEERVKREEEEAAAALAKAEASVAAAAMGAARAAILRDAAEAERFRSDAVRAAANVAKAREMTRISDAAAHEFERTSEASSGPAIFTAYSSRLRSSPYSPAEYRSVIFTSCAFVIFVLWTRFWGLELNDVQLW